MDDNQQQALRHLSAAFENKLGASPTRFFRAPGRVNLIGEHTDYNDGYVLPAAIGREVLMAVRPRPDRMVRAMSLQAEEPAEFSLDNIGFDTQVRWSNYLRGVAFLLEESDHRLEGMDALITSTVPVGSGLSSSAALEVCTGLALAAISGLELGPVELALLCQRAENEFVGVPCGIMDQFICVLAQQGNALQIDCRTLDYRPVPVGAEAAVVIVDSGVRRQLAGSEYHTRREQCEEGVRLLREHLPQMRALRDVSLEDLERWGGELPEVVGARCRHVVSENERVVESTEALREGDLARFGKLMVASHCSLRDDYQVSCPELDVLVELAMAAPGAYGSRLTGAGFGGCTVSLVAREQASAFMRAVGEGYREQTGRAAEIYLTYPERGAQELEGGE